MSADYIIEQQEEEVRESNYNSIIKEASHYVVVIDKITREEAYEKSKELHIEREDPSSFVVTNEETGEVEYLISNLEPPVIKETAQLLAIKNELYSKFEYDL